MFALGHTQSRQWQRPNFDTKIALNCSYTGMALNPMTFKVNVVLGKFSI